MAKIGGDKQQASVVMGKRTTEKCVYALPVCLYNCTTKQSVDTTQRYNTVATGQRKGVMLKRRDVLQLSTPFGTWATLM